MAKNKEKGSEGRREAKGMGPRMGLGAFWREEADQGNLFLIAPSRQPVPVPEEIGLATGRYLKIVGMTENNLGKDKKKNIVLGLVWHNTSQWHPLGCPL